MANVTVTNTTAALSGKTLQLTDADQTITGNHTYSRGASAPFAVNSGAAAVTNLDADKLDGQEGSYYRDATNINAGTVATARLGSGSATSSTFLRGDSTWAAPATTTNPVRILDRDVAVATVTNTTTETTVYSFSIVGGTLGSTKALRLTLIGDYLNDSGSSRDLTLRVKLGATTVFAGVPTASLTTSATRRPVRLMCEISALNATNAQVAAGSMFVGNNIGVSGTGGVAASGGDLLGVATGIAEDSTGTLAIAVTAQHSFADATTTFRAHTVQLELLD